MKIAVRGNQRHIKIIRNELGSVSGLNVGCSLCVLCRGSVRRRTSNWTVCVDGFDLLCDTERR
jgi:hypothetical protein